MLLGTKRENVAEFSRKSNIKTITLRMNWETFNETNKFQLFVSSSYRETAINFFFILDEEMMIN